MLFIRVPVENLVKDKSQPGEVLDTTGQEQVNIQDPVVEEALTKLTNGILIITEGQQLLYANDCACRILRQISQERKSTELIPREITYLCNSVAEARRRFPQQHWIMKSKICISSAVTFSVVARYMKLDTLTERETEIWLLQRANYTYKQIASELFIAPNTVKKHMQNIHLKQKSADDNGLVLSTNR